MTRPYGHLPKEITPSLLVTQYEILNDSPRVRGSAYELLGQLYGVTGKRVQQIILAERKRRAVRDAVTSSGNQTPQR